MRVTNVHSRQLDTDARAVGALLDSLAGPDDRLWPGDRWPAMRLDGPLRAGARGGHGPIRYEVTDYEPGRRVRFRFTGPAGFHGGHGFEVRPGDGDRTALRHELRMSTSGRAVLSWPLVYRPLHDALIEDALDRAAGAVGEAPRRAGWSPWVRLLRSVLGGRG